MSVLVVGGDKLGNIKDNLKQRGFEEISHLSGRKKSQKSIKIPENTDIVLVLTDFVNHQIAKTIKKQTKDHSTKILYAKRSWVHIEESLKKFNNMSCN
ncbi:DUF2325 domain-containing protein [Clostridium ganghwense]|uniref:DUF2325 domain-containing protein n=1 Tax=Clostridium ganghwense TaxID=312089 RepID=A0ABT4CN14_9CLOT|nr:DUF2325 domain-containing protein [Clostridium ganghwense]MCY6369611.1 DUF2325 domain-containing protein [Clostridium ganghwense]